MSDYEILSDENDSEVEEEQLIIERSKKRRGSCVLYNYIQTFEKYFNFNMLKLFFMIYLKNKVMKKLKNFYKIKIIGKKNTELKAQKE